MTGRDPMLYLASMSPRRRELLAQIGVSYRTVAVSVDEAWRGGETPELYVLRLALDKARAGRVQTAATGPRWHFGVGVGIVR